MSYPLSALLPSFVKRLSDRVIYRKHRLCGQLRKDSLSIQMDITNCCNIHCVMCSTHRLPMACGQEPRFMPVELFAKIAHQAFPFASTVRLACSFEPTLHPDFGRILEIAGASEAGDVGFDTNGVLLDDKMSRDILLSGIDEMSVSLDGWSSPVFEAIRCGAKRDLVYGNLERFLSLREELNPAFGLEVDFALMRENAHELLDVVRYAAMARCRCFNIIHIVPGIPENPRYIGNDREFCDPLLDEARSVLAKSGTLFCIYGPGFDHSRCEEPWSRFLIDSQGKVYGCGQRFALPYGDFNSQDFEEIWDGLPFLKLRSDLARGVLRDECLTCSALAEPIKS